MVVGGRRIARLPLVLRAVSAFLARFERWVGFAVVSWWRRVLAEAQCAAVGSLGSSGGNAATAGRYGDMRPIVGSNAPAMSRFLTIDRREILCCMGAPL